MKTSKHPAIWISLTVLAALTILGVAYLFGDGLKHFRSGENIVSVTGMAQKDFTSDLAVLNGQVTRQAKTVEEAYSLLKKDMELIQGFLKDNQVSEDEILVTSVFVMREYDYVRVTEYQSKPVQTGYNLQQSLKIESRDIEKLEKLTKLLPELLMRGVEINVEPIEYYYTKLADLKLDMLAQASRDGRQRADQIAKESGSKLKKLVRAQMGVFQIIAQNSSENYSWGGAFNTRDKNKTATVTVSMRFSMR